MRWAWFCVSDPDLRLLEVPMRMMMRRGASVGELLMGLVVLGIVGAVVAVALQQCGNAVGQYGQGLSQSRERGSEVAIALTMRQVHQALLGETLADPRLRLPEDPQEMMAWLVERGIIRRGDIEAWAAPAPGDPVFFVVSSAYRGGLLGSQRVAMYEHPENHGGAGGTVVYADGSVVFLEQVEFERAVASARSGGR